MIIKRSYRRARRRRRPSTQRRSTCGNLDTARYRFNKALAGSKWSKLPGLHVLRYSFASNLAAGGVDQRIIDEWMGHQTEEMRRRYRHLFPDQQREALSSVFGEVGDKLLKVIA
ncbi:MAG: tyrosine-type recombinase/integrase [Planctomycetota bacterium]